MPEMESDPNCCEQHAEVAVIGLSIAGTLAAIRAKALGIRVVRFANALDSGNLDDIAVVPPTLLNSEPISGSTFSELASEHIGVRDMAVRITRLPHADQMAIELLDGTVFTADRVVYAPFGTETGLLSLPFAEEFIGWGVSKCASADAGHDAGLPVAVFGCTQRAAEQALIAARAGALPTIYCAEKHFQAPGFDRLLDQSGIAIREDTKILGLHAAPSGELCGLSVADASGTHSDREASALFLAHGLSCTWSIFSGQVKAIVDERVIVAGIASGIPYWNYPAQIYDVQRVVDAIRSPLK